MRGTPLLPERLVESPESDSQLKTFINQRTVQLSIKSDRGGIEQSPTVDKDCLHFTRMIPGMPGDEGGSAQAADLAPDTHMNIPDQSSHHDRPWNVSRRGTFTSIPEEKTSSPTREQFVTEMESSFEADDASSVHRPHLRRTSWVEGDALSGRLSVQGSNLNVAYTQEYLPLSATKASDHSDRWILDHHKGGFMRAIKRKKSFWLRLENRWASGTHKSHLRNPDLEAVEEKDQGPPKGVATGLANATSNKRHQWQRPSDEQTFRINLAELQRLRLRKLQWKLVKHVKELKDLPPNEQEPEGWETVLEDYIKAFKDYDFMVQCKDMPRDPFLVTGERKIDDYVIRKIFTDIKATDCGNPETIELQWEDNNEPIGRTRSDGIAQSRMKGFRMRLGMAAVGAFFLIAPMWIMVFRNTLMTGLISTTAFVCVFGIILAAKSDSAKDVLSGTAAYAAVLVVYVGLGSFDS
jgi:hypothetical protein